MKFTKLSTKRITTMALTVLLAGNMVLTACSGESKNSTTSKTEVTENVATETSTSEDASTTTSEATTTTSETTEETTTTAASEQHDTISCEKVELDGIQDHFFESTDYCYIESEKCIFFLDKDIRLPGDFGVNVDAIVNEIEKQLGLSACHRDFENIEVPNQSVYFDGYNPWANCSVGNKIPVFLFVDREDEKWISCASSNFVILVIYELYTDEAWHLIDPTGEQSYRRSDYINYTEIAHELTHTITQRYSNLTNILGEGIAEYMGRTVIEALADSYPSINVTREKRYLLDYTIPEAIHADNAERVFIEDYNQLSAAQRGAEYAYGMYLCRFLDEKSGDGFFAEISRKIEANKLSDPTFEYDEGVVRQYVSVLKEIYGEDIFVEFGNWCVEQGVLQET